MDIEPLDKAPKIHELKVTGYICIYERNMKCSKATIFCYIHFLFVLSMYSEEGYESLQ